MGTSATIDLMLIDINNLTAIITTSIVDIIITTTIITSIIEINITTIIITSIIKRLSIENIKERQLCKTLCSFFVIANISVMLVVMLVVKGW